MISSKRLDVSPIRKKTEKAARPEARASFTIRASAEAQVRFVEGLLAPEKAPTEAMLRARAKRKEDFGY